MPLEWTHDHKSCAEVPCTRDTECAGFPTMADRVDMARAAYGEYSEADGTSEIDFFRDVVLFMFSEAGRRNTATTRELLIHNIHLAAGEWETETQRIADHWRKRK